MKPRVLAVAFALLLVGPVFAAGFGTSGAPPERIPTPAHDFAATLEDQSGTTVEVTQISYNGEVYLYGLVGLGQQTVPFENIKEIRIEPSTVTGKRVAFVTTRDGKSVSLVIDSDVPAYGRTSFGTYSITVDKIRRISFATP